MYYYRYRILDRKKREKIDLNIFPHSVNIRNVLKEIFKDNIICININKKYFEFILKDEASKGKLHDIGKKTVEIDDVLKDARKMYNSGHKLFESIKIDNVIFYGFLESILEVGESDYRLIFDVCPIFDFQVDENKEKKQEVNEQIDAFTIDVTISDYSSINMIKVNNKLVLYNWYYINFNNKKEVYNKVEGDLYYSTIHSLDNYIEKDAKCEIISIKEIVDISITNHLENKFNLLRLKNSFNDIDEFVKMTLKFSETIKFITAYNVGQGNCNGLCNEKGAPLIYYDFGGGYGKDKEEALISQRFCVHYNPIVILSHWDKDHWIGANRFKEILKSTWIVPYQKIGVQAFNPAKEISSKGKLCIWHDDGIINFSQFVLFRCNGSMSHRHNNGLGIYAKLKNRDNTISKYLLPGDNRYRFIDDEFKNDLDGLVATHHGGEYSNSAHNEIEEIPINNRNGKIIYSFGIGNSHEHPSKRDDYHERGWTNNLDTMNGHCALNLEHPTNSECNGVNCDLNIVQA